MTVRDTFYTKYNILHDASPGLSDIADMNITVLLDNSESLDTERVDQFLSFLVDFVASHNTSFDLVLVNSPIIYTNVSSLVQLEARPIDYSNRYPVDAMMNYKLNLIYSTKSHAISQRTLLCILITDAVNIFNTVRLYTTFMNRPEYENTHQAVYCLATQSNSIRDFERMDRCSNTGVVFGDDPEPFVNLLRRPFLHNKQRVSKRTCCGIQ